MLSEVLRRHQSKTPSAHCKILQMASDVDRFTETECTTENGHEISNLECENSVSAQVASKESTTELTPYKLVSREYRKSGGRRTTLNYKVCRAIAHLSSLNYPLALLLSFFLAFMENYYLRTDSVSVKRKE
jgi:hypothetical protein